MRTLNPAELIFVAGGFDHHPSGAPRDPNFPGGDEGYDLDPNAQRRRFGEFLVRSAVAILQSLAADNSGGGPSVSYESTTTNKDGSGTSVEVKAKCGPGQEATVSKDGASCKTPPSTPKKGG